MGFSSGFPTVFQLRVELPGQWELWSVSGSRAGSGFPKTQESSQNPVPWLEWALGLVSRLLTWLEV